MTFEKLGLSGEIVNALKKLGFELPTEIQQKAIPVILGGIDAICRSETGSGKTFAFGLPIIQKIDRYNTNIQALVICPTRELAMQVADELKKVCADLELRVCAVFGGSTIQRQIDSLKKNPHIVVGTTGRIMDLINKKALKIEQANYVVLDEADEMLDMGFRPDVEKILAHTKADRQTLLFSAMMPDGVKELAEIYQKNAALVEVGSANKAISKIDQKYIYANKKYKREVLRELFYSDVYGKTIVFVNTRQFAEDLEYYLNKSSIACSALHGDLRQTSRKRILQNFRDGKLDVIIATDVASRGLDIKDVKYIINYDLPHELEYYVHRIGRTGRAGHSGNVINIITSLEQLSYMREIEKETKAKILAFETESENLKQFFVDTKKLAQKTSRFSKQNRAARIEKYEYLEFEDSKKSKGEFKKSKSKNFNLKSIGLNNKGEPSNKKTQKTEKIKRNKNGRNFNNKKYFEGDKNSSVDKIIKKFSSKNTFEKQTKIKNKTSKNNRNAQKNNSKKSQNVWYSKFIKK